MKNIVITITLLMSSNVFADYCGDASMEAVNNVIQGSGYVVKTQAEVPWTNEGDVMSAESYELLGKGPTLILDDGVSVKSRDFMVLYNAKGLFYKAYVGMTKVTSKDLSECKLSHITFPKTDWHRYPNN